MIRTAIRAATFADLDAIAALHAEARATYYQGHLPEADFDGRAERARTREAWRHALTAGRRRDSGVLCAAYEEALVAVAAYRTAEGVTTLTQFHVRPSMWRRGIGTELHIACVNAWLRAGIRTVRLEVFEPDPRARSFCARHRWYLDPGNPRHDTHPVLRLDVPYPAPPGAGRSK
ncbi:GNAT family N-acetyltransferase [Streptomyces sp. NPDC088116]|uniref:GNAT family N-acetyltransferase n=1 Tax=Streptomyces sp. NPDC088116 TaxID=3365825 RepID=UPI0037FA223F